MSREIKFRAWTNNSWINEGMLYDYQDTTYVESFGFNEEELPLMQYTGLKDKNDIEIYEGDILDAGDRIVKVVWHKYAGQWDTDFIKYKGEQSSNGLFNSDWKYRTTVIGNIYENPELLATI